ncbi:MAG: NYN domain-containing protein [Nocardioidaceae bacterium]
MNTDEPPLSAPDETGSPSEPPATRVPVLPEPVRLRVVSLCADVLDLLSGERLPASLRPVLRFARSRRARLAAGPIAAALLDDQFRERVAAAVRPQHASVLTAIEHGEPVAADPVDIAALAYLVRPSGWELALAAAIEQVVSAEVESDTTLPQVLRLREQLDAARQELAGRQRRLREQVAGLKAENGQLRNKLAAERSRTQQAVTDAAAAAESARVAVEESRLAVVGAAAQSRRLRARIDALETQLQADRASGRGQRGGEAVRARLLLETLLDAAQGLRRELALPPVDVLPADGVLTALGPEADAPDRPRDRALDDRDPALLEHLLALPRAHLLVDGYNVTKLQWDSSSLEVQRNRLVRELAPVAARNAVEVTVVFDGAELTNRPPVIAPRGVRVRFSPGGVTADEVLRDLVRAEPAGRPVVVVSSDREVRDWVSEAGARSLPAPALLALLGRS